MIKAIKQESKYRSAVTLDPPNATNKANIHDFSNDDISELHSISPA